MSLQFHLTGLKCERLKRARLGNICRMCAEASAGSAAAGVLCCLFVELFCCSQESASLHCRVYGHNL